MRNIGEIHPMKLGCVLGVLGALLGSTQDAFAQATPDGVMEYTVVWPNEISGLAAVDNGFLVVGDDTPKHYYSWPDGKAHRVWSEDKRRVCDAESIDVGYGPKGEKLYVMLGEDFGKVYVRGASSIQLPDEFLEQCGRGAEGISVRWSTGGWDLAVLWEGGISDDEHEPMAKKSKKCKHVKSKTCTADKGPHNARVIVYRLSVDGTNMTPEAKFFTLETAQLLTSEEPEEAFRATDIAWYRNGFLVLLGSTPIKAGLPNPYRRTWIQGFDMNGNPIVKWRIKLETRWGDYRRSKDGKSKNWEALDTTLDDRRLILGYDAKGPSEIVVFDPGFD